jgi:ABC-type polysaccharide/polyol phosphate transport system ATPase subunit
MMNLSKLSLSPAARPADSFSEDTVIALQNVGVRYRIPKENISGVKEFAIRWLQRRIAFEEFWALKDASLEVKRGEAFGIIGRNGSGKSTMLKVIARVLYPSQGRLMLKGRVAPLLELGAGFHPELTGRENIYLNSALLGRTRKEVALLLPEIIDFAEVGKFIDSPLRTYSTGMVARLGFAVATSERPQILLVDEVLSVGDAPFQKKCIDRMYAYQELGTTIVIVSHSMATIESFCQRAVWLNGGQVQALGEVSEVIEQYGEMFSKERKQRASENTSVQDGPSTLDEPDAYTNRSRAYTDLDRMGEIYPTQDVFNIKQGAVAFWMRFDPARPFQPAVIFHTDDSRFVIYVGSYYSDKLERDIHVLSFRAGGNCRAMDTFYGLNTFPEISISMDLEEAPGGTVMDDGQWHLVVMTWNGSPAGDMEVYLNAHKVGEREYTRRHNNELPLPAALSVGRRPLEWVGEIVENEQGDEVDLRPPDDMNLANSSCEIRSLRLYRSALLTDDVLKLYLERAMR